MSRIVFQLKCVYTFSKILHYALKNREVSQRAVTNLPFLLVALAAARVPTCSGISGSSKQIYFAVITKSFLQ